MKPENYKIELLIDDPIIDFSIKNKLKINGIITPAILSRELLQDLHHKGIDGMEMIRMMAIDWYLNNPRIVRKIKLEK